MGKTESTDNDNNGQPHDGAVAPAAEAPGQAQLSFFDTVTPPTMTTETCAPADTEQVHVEAPEADAETGSQEALVGNDTDILIPVDSSESLGQRLRAAREARDMRCEQVAQAMRLPLATVQAIEADRYDRIGEGIYLRSYLSKYLRLLDLPQVLADRVLNQQPDPPPLITSGTISRPRYLFERYSSSALYLILTAVIIVPAVWLAMRAGFETNLAQITPLDTPDGMLAAPTAGGASGNVSANGAQAPSPTSASTAAPNIDEPPLVASLAPFPTIKRESADSEPAEKSVAAVPGEHTLRLTLAESSWVEIVAADGEKLEYGLLAAGTARTYHSTKLIDVRVGNANGASVDIDGKAQDLTPFRHANVAHFKLASGESTISHSGG